MLLLYPGELYRLLGASSFLTILQLKIDHFKVALYKNWYFFIKIFFNQFLFYYNILDT
jgi:hypothetical protein